MHKDGVVYFPIHGSARGLLVQNNEYSDDELLFPDGTANWNEQKTKKAQAAHGVSIIEITKQRGGQWRDLRFSTDAEPNEPNRFGWVVEIDPFDPNSTPVKRTALGRLKHEGAWVQEARDGRVVVYTGDDQANEYIYRYVSRLPWRRARRLGINPLNDGTLYVGKFNADGTGVWLPLTPSNPALAGWGLNDILINTRGAADAVGATKMDRPEWIDTFPDSLTAIATLTNNSSRSAATVEAANPRAPNTYGHIIRWRYRFDFSEPTFFWDIFALGGDPENPAHGSTIKGDKFGPLMACTSRPAVGSGSRPTCPAVRSTRVRMPGLATTRCCARTRIHARYGASSLARTSAR